MRTRARQGMELAASGEWPLLPDAAHVLAEGTPPSLLDGIWKPQQIERVAIGIHRNIWHFVSILQPAVISALVKSRHIANRADRSKMPPRRHRVVNFSLGNSFGALSLLNLV